MGARNDRERHLYFEMKNWSKVILEQSLVCCFRITSKLNISGALKRHLVLRKVRLVCPEDYYLVMRGKITSSAIYTSISKIQLKTKRYSKRGLRNEFSFGSCESKRHVYFDNLLISVLGTYISHIRKMLTFLIFLGELEVSIFI